MVARSSVLSLALIGILLLAVPTPASADPGHLEGYLPSAAHAPGRFGSFWTTDLWIYQQGASTVHLWFNRAGEDNTAVESVVVTLANPVTHFPDVVSTLFGTDGMGSIHYLADGPVTVTSRTWTTEPGGGSYGQTIVGAPLSQCRGQNRRTGALRMVVDRRPVSGEPGAREHLRRRDDGVRRDLHGGRGRPGTPQSPSSYRSG
jgi:hypothetical protein